MDEAKIKKFNNYVNFIYRMWIFTLSSLIFSMMCGFLVWFMLNAWQDALIMKILVVGTISFILVWGPLMVLCFFVMCFKPCRYSRWFSAGCGSADCRACRI